MSADIPPPNCSCILCQGNRQFIGNAQMANALLGQQNAQQQQVCTAKPPPVVDILARCARCAHYRWCHRGEGPNPRPPLPPLPQLPPCPASPVYVCEAFVPPPILKPVAIQAKAPLERLGEVEYALGELAEQIAYGGERPGRVPGDWRKLPREVLIGKAIRHLLSAAAGQKLDAEGRSHLAAALADCAMAVEKERA